MHQMIWMIQEILGFHIIMQILTSAPDDLNDPEDSRFPYNPDPHAPDVSNDP